jgi:hypothetical protein
LLLKDNTPETGSNVLAGIVAQLRGGGDFYTGTRPGVGQFSIFPENFET